MTNLKGHTRKHMRSESNMGYGVHHSSPSIPLQLDLSPAREWYVGGPSPEWWVAYPRDAGWPIPGPTTIRSEWSGTLFQPRVIHPSTGPPIRSEVDHSPPGDGGGGEGWATPGVEGWRACRPFPPPGVTQGVAAGPPIQPVFNLSCL